MDIENTEIDLSRPPQIIHQEENFLVLYKPERYYVHPPESRFAKQKIGRNTCIHWLMDIHSIKANPIHRLDYATEGLVIFGIDRPTTQKLNQMMIAHQITKKYDAIVRGWFKEDFGKIDLPLELDSSKKLVDCMTLYSTHKKIEVPYQVNSDFLTSRYSWLNLELKTGRWHQIRRHLNRTAHPVIGDREHGDSHHNRFFRDHYQIDGLLLRANYLAFPHPIENRKLEFQVPQSERWNKIHELFTATS